VGRLNRRKSVGEILKGFGENRPSSSRPDGPAPHGASFFSRGLLENRLLLILIFRCFFSTRQLDGSERTEVFKKHLTHVNQG